MQRKLKGDAYTLTIVRRKGGIGTTTATIALATGLAARGYATLILEGDDNRRLSRILLGLDRMNAPPVQDTQTTHHLFTHPEEGIGNSPFTLNIPELLQEIQGKRDAILTQRGWTNPAPLRIVPGSRSLRRLEADFIFAVRSSHRPDFQPYTQLMRAISVTRQDFDFILIDTPSMLSLITMNEVMAAQYPMFLMDFDPDSRYDFDEAVEFFRLVVSNCASIGAPPPQPLGVILNKYTGSAEDEALYRVYTEEHYDEDIEGLTPPILPFPILARLPYDDAVMKRAMHKRRPVHVTDPQSALGNAMYQLCNVVEVRLGLRPAIGGAR